MGFGSGGPLPRLQLPLTLSHEGLALACVARSTGPDFGADHGGLLPLLRAGAVTTFGQW